MKDSEGGRDNSVFKHKHGTVRVSSQAHSLSLDMWSLLTLLGPFSPFGVEKDKCPDSSILSIHGGSLEGQERQQDLPVLKTVN